MMSKDKDCSVPTSDFWIYNTFPDNLALVAASCRPLEVLHQHHNARGYLMRVQATTFDFRSRNKKRGLRGLRVLRGCLRFSGVM